MTLEILGLNPGWDNIFLSTVLLCFSESTVSFDASIAQLNLLGNEFV